MDESHRTRLAEGPICMVEECSCGVMHLTIGPVTLRLQADAVESMWVTLGEAISRHAARDRDRAMHIHMGNCANPHSDERLS
ncbi:hypothetical protein LVJ94_40770 [Pendulispora rubella]|uniref:Uncharacterized protein n=1 Tax=Pendulispora rubella TaxID=2741070 RepID=A0ABZ2L1W5_9BACT